MYLTSLIVLDDSLQSSSILPWRSLTRCASLGAMRSLLNLRSK